MNTQNNMKLPVKLKWDFTEPIFVDIDRTTYVVSSSSDEEHANELTVSSGHQPSFIIQSTFDGETISNVLKDNFTGAAVADELVNRIVEEVESYCRYNETGMPDNDSPIDPNDLIPGVDYKLPAL